MSTDAWGNALGSSATSLEVGVGGGGWIGVVVGGVDGCLGFLQVGVKGVEGGAGGLAGDGGDGVAVTLEGDYIGETRGGEFLIDGGAAEEVGGGAVIDSGRGDGDDGGIFGEGDSWGGGLGAGGGEDPEGELLARAAAMGGWEEASVMARASTYLMSCALARRSRVSWAVPAPSMRMDLSWDLAAS